MSYNQLNKIRIHESIQIINNLYKHEKGKALPFNEMLTSKYRIRETIIEKIEAKKSPVMLHLGKKSRKESLMRNAVFIWSQSISPQFTC